MPDVPCDYPTFRDAAGLARAQWGVVCVRQLHALGFGESAAREWLREGRAVRLHRGVYAIGHDALRWEGRLLAAVLACGEDAALSFLSAAGWHELRASRGVLIDVSVPKQRRPRRGLRIHLARDLGDDVIEEEGLRVTTPTRTLIDLATLLPLAALEPVAARAEARGLIDHKRLARARSPKLRKIFGDGRPQLTRSRDEARFLAAIRAAGLPVPEMNAWLTHGGGEEWQADALWRSERVIVELDDDSHLTRAAFENDRRKDAVRQADGYRTLRFTRRQLREDTRGVLGVIESVLAT